MDKDILEIEVGVKSPYVGLNEMADELLWVENGFDRKQTMNEPKKARKDMPMQAPEEIAEDVEWQNEVYEEFSSDFDDLNEYDNIEDEANADMIEAAADFHDVACPYSHTCNYTMISDPNEDDVVSTSQS